MKKVIGVFLLLAMALALTGCGTVETGNVGVRTAWDGHVQLTELPPGFYTAFMSSVQEFSTKEITVPMSGLKPKARDNLSLANVDVEVYYTVRPDQVAELSTKYANRHLLEGGIWYPAFELVRSMGRDAVYATFAEYDSLIVHQKRDEVREAIEARTQRALEQSDPGVFRVTKVVVRDIRTDPSVEEAIKTAVSRNKELEAKSVELQIAGEQVLINQALTQSLTPEILRQRELEVIEAACTSGKSTCILTVGQGTGPLPLVNVR
ncbi:SPFH domain-containing protein [Ectothiorhodospira shaposhnikovii]|uniref:SPFH domain-containing protein n=1 Tax=Ectothiorhodospira shaposhnikovii TaxID=1054 RepID=UPI001EE8A188|nr:SPFH domain-containing protein [Ectothiorhodospira shaposhnikovii]MCG5512793.1 hypothetical protein [Ectothiorhodospira shaposhnikovii]